MIGYFIFLIGLILVILGAFPFKNNQKPLLGENSRIAAFFLGALIAVATGIVIFPDFLRSTPQPAPVQASAPDTQETPLIIEPTPTAEPISTETQTPPEEFPPVLDLERVDITLNLEKYPYKFVFGDPRVRKATASVLGTYQDPDTDAELTVQVDSPLGSSKVGWIEAMVLGQNLAAATWLLPYVATMPYGGSKPEEAKAWVESHWQKVRRGISFTQRFGNARFTLEGDNIGSVWLRIGHYKWTDWLSKKLEK